MFRVLATSSAALIAAAAPVLAEITPAEAWDHMVEQYSRMGYTVTEGSRDEAGDTLTITDAVMATENENATSTMTMPKVVLNQTGDGNVHWVVEGDITGQTVAIVPDQDDLTISYTVTAAGNETVTSGSVEDLTHDFKVDTMTMKMDMPVEEGVSLPLEFVVQDLTGSQRSLRPSPDAAEETTADFKTGEITFNVTGEELPTEGGTGPTRIAAEGKLASVEGSGKIVLAPGEFDMQTQLTEAIEAGTMFEFSLTHGAGEMSYDMSGPDEGGQDFSFTGSSTMSGGDLTGSLSSEGLHYGGTSNDAQATIQVSQLPFPISYGIKSGKFDLKMPVLASEEANPFSLVATISDLTVDDAIWGLFDPQAKLPRDPASMNIDVSGDLLLKSGLFDMAEAASQMPEPAADDTDATAPVETPVAMEQPEVYNLKINEILLKVAGAEATVTGELTGANGEPISEDPPVGQIHGRFVGINTLLSTLGEMGLIPADQLMATRMGMAMFAKPVEGEEDTLETDIEFREGGSVFANGQQVQ